MITKTEYGSYYLDLFFKIFDLEYYTLHLRISAQENDLPLRRSHSAVRIVLRQSIPQQQFFWAATKKPHRPRGHDRGRHGIAMNMEQPYKRWVVRVRRWHLKNPSLDRSITLTALPPSLVQPTTTRRRGERKGSPLFCDPCFFAGKFFTCALLRDNW